MRTCILVILLVTIPDCIFSAPLHRRQLGQSAANLGLGAAQQGKPTYGFNAQGGGSNLNNFNGGYQAGIGYPVYNGGSNGPSVGIGGTVGGGFGASGGTFSGSKPNYGVGIGVNIPFGK